MNTNELHKKFVEYGVFARDWQRKCALLLPDIEKYQVWSKKGFFSIYEYAAKLAGMTRLQVDDSLRILRKIEDKPDLMEVARVRGVNAVRPVASIATSETAGYWASKAKQMSKNELETFVHEVRKSEVKRDVANLETDKFEDVVLSLRPDLAAKFRTFLRGDVNTLIAEFIEFYEKNLQAEKPEVVRGGSRGTPVKIVKYITKRCQGKCEFPGCKRAFVNLHHIDRYVLTKIHDPDRIVALCRAHHDLIHRGLIANEDREVENWSVRKNPDHTALSWYVDSQVQFYRRS